MATIDGIVSGLNTTAMVNAIVQANAGPQRQMKRQVTDFNRKLEGISGLSNRMSELSTAIKTMSTPDTFNAFTLSQTNTTQFTATSTGNAPPGSYNLQVLGLASNEVEVSQGYADQNAKTIGQGTFSLTLAGVQTNITVDATNDSLATFAASLNNVTGVTAFVLDTGTGANPFKLVVQADDTGAANTLSFNSTGLAAGSNPSFTQQNAASDAHFTINGIDVFSKTNDPADAIPGVTLKLTNTGTAPVRLAVEKDTQAISDKVQEIINAYNKTVGYYQTQLTYIPGKNQKGRLVGDGTARSAMDQLSQMVSTSYTTSGTLSALSQIGIATNRDGSLKFDSANFQKALVANPDGVQALFTDPNGPMAKMKAKIDNVYVDPTTGTLSTRKDSLNNTIKDLGLRIDQWNVRLADQAKTIRARFTNMELAMAKMQATGNYLAGLFAQKNG